MLVSYDFLSPEAKTIIYPGSRKFFSNELTDLEESLREFCESLEEVNICFKIEYNRFIVFLISESTPLDLDGYNALAAFLQDLERKFEMVLLDRVNVCFKQGKYVQMKEIPDFKKLIKNKGVSKKTIVFDHMINTKMEYENSWEVPAGESWLSHFF